MYFLLYKMCQLQCFHQSCGKITLNQLEILCCFSHYLFWQFWNPRVCPIFVICWADYNVDCHWAQDSVLSGKAPPPKGQQLKQCRIPSFVLMMVHLPPCLHACMDNQLSAYLTKDIVSLVLEGFYVKAIKVRNDTGNVWNSAWILSSFSEI